MRYTFHGQLMWDAENAKYVPLTRVPTIEEQFEIIRRVCTGECIWHVLDDFDLLIKESA